MLQKDASSQFGRAVFAQVISIVLSAGGMQLCYRANMLANFESDRNDNDDTFCAVEEKWCLFFVCVSF